MMLREKFDLTGRTALATGSTRKTICSCLLAAGVAFGVSGRPVQSQKAEWEDLKVNSVNRLPARTYSMPLAKEADALTDALEPGGYKGQSLLI